MENVKKIDWGISGDWTGVQKLIALFAYSLVCIRGNLWNLGIETIHLTLLINFFILLSIDFRHIKKQLWLLSFFVLLVLYNREALALVDILALVYVLKGVSINKIIFINAILLILFICCWQYALAIGVLKSETWVMPKGVAQTLGYTNPNCLGFCGFQIISSLYLLCRKCSKVLIIAATLAINELFFSISLSRTSWLSGLVLSLVLLFLTFKLLRPWMRYIIGVIPLILTTLIIYFAKHIDSYPVLDIIFTTRFSGHSAMLGQMSLINWVIGIRPMDVPMDGSYTSLLFATGIIGLILFLRKFYKALVKNYSYLKEYMPFLIGMLACGVGENTLSSISGLSLIFWFLFINSDNLYGKPILKRL